MEYEIEEWSAFTVSGYKHSFEKHMAFTIIPELWDNALHTGKLQSLLDLLETTDLRPCGLLGVCVGGNGAESPTMDYYMGVTTCVDTSGCVPVPFSKVKGMVSYQFSAATWAVFNADGELPHSVQAVHKRLASEWLPTSGAETAGLPMLESYLPNNRQEIWVAVKKN